MRFVFITWMFILSHILIKVQFTYHKSGKLKYKTNNSVLFSIFSVKNFMLLLYTSL